MKDPDIPNFPAKLSANAKPFERGVSRINKNSHLCVTSLEFDSGFRKILVLSLSKTKNDCICNLVHSGLIYL